MASWTLALSQARAANAFSAQYDHPGPTEKPNTLPARARLSLPQAHPTLFPLHQTQGCGSRDQRWKLCPRPSYALVTHMLAYMRWPFCWFCSRVLARSMGNTQVTPISPAMPPLMSLAGRLCMQGQVSGLPYSTTGWGGGWGGHAGERVKAKTEAQGLGGPSDLICLSAIYTK